MLSQEILNLFCISVHEVKARTPDSFTSVGTPSGVLALRGSAADLFGSACAWYRDTGIAVLTAENLVPGNDDIVVGFTLYGPAQISDGVQPFIRCVSQL